MTDTSAPRRARSLPIWLPFAILMTILALFSVYWGVVRWQAVQIVHAQIDALEDQGYVIDYDRMRSGGYPLRVTAIFDDLQITTPPDNDGRATQVLADSLRIHVLPLNFTKIRAELRDGVELLSLTPQGPTPWVTTDRAVVNIRLADIFATPHVRQIAVAAGASAVTGEDESGPTTTRIGGARVILGPDRQGDRLRADITLSQPAFNGANGEDLPERLHLEASIRDVHLFEPSLAAVFFPDAPDTAFRYDPNDDRDHVNLRGEMTWSASEASVAMASRMRLNPDGLLDGAGQFAMKEPRSAFRHMTAVGVFDEEQGDYLAEAIERYMRNTNRNSLSVNVKDGRLLVEIPLTELFAIDLPLQAWCEDTGPLAPQDHCRTR